eukprot:2206931-Rhodomonas_salina.5
MDATPPRGCEKEGEEMVNALTRPAENELLTVGHQCSVNSVMGSRRCLALKQSRGCLGSAETGGEVGCTKGHKNNNARAACSNTRERLPARTMPGKHAAELGQHRAFCPSCLPSQACRFSVLLAEREAIILDNGQGMLGTAKNADNRPAKTCKKLKNKPKQASVWPRALMTAIVYGRACRVFFWLAWAFHLLATPSAAFGRESRGVQWPVATGGRRGEGWKGGRGGNVYAFAFLSSFSTRIKHLELLQRRPFQYEVACGALQLASKKNRILEGMGWRAAADDHTGGVDGGGGKEQRGARGGADRVSAKRSAPRRLPAAGRRRTVAGPVWSGARECGRECRSAICHAIAKPSDEPLLS